MEIARVAFGRNAWMVDVDYTTAGAAAQIAVRGVLYPIRWKLRGMLGVMRFMDLLNEHRRDTYVGVIGIWQPVCGAGACG